MGIYINPLTEPKETFLAKHGIQIASDAVDFAAIRATGAVPVCLVDNRHFTAAAVCCDDAETKTFLSPDAREKVWFSVPIEVLKTGSGVSEKEIARL